jgi:hypothetical protein
MDEALPVRIVTNEIGEKAAELGSLNSYALQGTEPAFRILPQTSKRHRATVLLNSATATAQVVIGKLNQMSTSQGFVLQAGQSIVIESAPEVWCRPITVNLMTLSVEDEQYLGH